jgi:hypothetical protein
MPKTSVQCCFVITCQQADMFRALQHAARVLQWLKLAPSFYTRAPAGPSPPWRLPSPRLPPSRGPSALGSTPAGMPSPATCCSPWLPQAPAPPLQGPQLLCSSHFPKSAPSPTPASRVTTAALPQVRLCAQQW